MKIAEILNRKGRDVKTIQPNATIETAIRRLRLDRIGALVVTEQGRMVGLLSERDIIWAFTKHGAETLDRHVADLMLRNIVTCEPGDTLKTAMHRMTHSRMRHLPVLDAGRLAGLISIGDVVKHRLDELETEAAVLRDAYLAAR